jgi:peptidylprolyl isomerase
MTKLSRILLTGLPLLTLAAADPEQLTPAEIVAAAPANAWQAVPADDLLLMDLASGQRVAIALAPTFAPVHVANIRTLARRGWFDGTSINRVQDNYVTQWGDVTEKKPLPPAIAATIPPEYERPAAGLSFRSLGYRDAYAAETGHSDGWPVGREGGQAWLVHCYGMVGVGRGLAPDTGNGAELYAVIGHAPRHLDRNIAVVGRVLGGMESLTALPRGTEALGFYKTADLHPGIVRVRMASDLPLAERPVYQILRSDTPAFAAWVKARANRKDDFFVRPAGALDICNAMPPVRLLPAQ